MIDSARPQDDGSSRFYAVVRIAFGLIALGVASRYAIKPFVYPDTAGEGHIVTLALWATLALPVVIGWHARVAAAGMAALGFVMVTEGGAFFSNSHMYLSVLTMALVALSDCERHYALRSRVGTPDEWPRHLMKLQLSIVYFFAGLQKINGDFLSGDVLNYSFERTVGPMAPLASLLKGSEFVQPMAFAVVVAEVSIAVMVWMKRPVAFGLALPLHTGMLLVAYHGIEVFGISLFGMLMFVLFMAFMKVPEEGRLVVWDDSCSFCRRWVSAVQRLDVFHALRFVGSSSLELYKGTGVTPQAATEALQVVEPNGTVRSGSSAVQAILSVLPAGFLVAPYMSLPGLSRLCNQAYRRVAASRSCAYGVAGVRVGQVRHPRRVVHEK